MADSTNVSAARPVKLTGRAFYESIGSPKMIVAPMVDRSEFAWRLLTRSYLDETRSKSVLAYTPMLHARMFGEQAKFRDAHFQPTRESLVSTSPPPPTVAPWLDGNPSIDRPLFVQFCANKPDELFAAAQYVAPYCDAVDLNLGCPQGIARSGRYGAFLQEDWDTIYRLINRLHNDLSVPVTAKMRILDTKETTLAYAKMILSAGASILTVHGRRREQKGHNTGVADWEMIRYLRDNLPPDTVLFANGNILNSGDLEPCLEATGADGIMSAEGNLSDPTIFAYPPSEPAGSREYWTGPDGRGGYRIDGVFRRYLDIIHKYVLDQDPPVRSPLYVSSDLQYPSEPDIYAQPDTISIPTPTQNLATASSAIASATTASESTKRKNENEDTNENGQPLSKKQKKNKNAAAVNNPNLKAMQGHLFQLLRPLISVHTDIRDALAKSRAGDIESFERVLAMVEDVTKRALHGEKASKQEQEQGRHDGDDDVTCAPSALTHVKYRRPWWVCQPHLRPLPDEALKIGAMTMSKKEMKKQVKNQPQSQEKGQREPSTLIQRSEEQHEQQQHEQQGEEEEEEEKENGTGWADEAVPISRTDEPHATERPREPSQRNAIGTDTGTDTGTSTVSVDEDTAKEVPPKPALVCG